MANVMLHSVPPQLHRALKARAALNNRSVEAEILAILGQAVQSRANVGMGTDFGAIVRQLGIGAPGPKSEP